MGPTTDSVVSSVDDTNDFVMTPSPMTEVGSYDELDAALVFCVPRLPFKSAESYIMLSYGESAKEGMSGTQTDPGCMLRRVQAISAVFSAVVLTTQ